MAGPHRNRRGQHPELTIAGSALCSLRTIENRVMKTIRDPRSIEILDDDAVAFSVKALAGHRHILLVTTRRDGRQIAAPRWFAVAGQRLTLRSESHDPQLSR